MANLQSLLRRRSEADELEFELVRTKTLSRLTALSNGELGIAEEDSTEELDETAATESGDETSALALPAPADVESVAASAADHDGTIEPDVAESRPRLIGVMIESPEPADPTWDHVAWSASDAGETSDDDHARSRNRLLR